MSIKYKIVSCLVISFLTLSGCRKLVTEPGPGTSINSANVYTEDATTAAVLTGIYATIMQSNSLQSSPFINSSYYCSLSADELTLWAGSSDKVSSGFYTNTLNSTTVTGVFWEPIYNIIYTTNAAIEGITNSTSLTPAVKQQALGEAYFIRAFSYFYLVNFYGGVPLVTTTNYEINENIVRSSTSTIYSLIVNDLLVAKNLLSSNYLDGSLINTTQERLRPTNWAAHALLARVYLYIQDYKDAILESDSVINNSNLFSLNGLDTVFTVNSTEAIWQLQPVTINWNTPDAQLFIIPNTGLSNNWPVYLSPSLLNSFDSGDLRRAEWTDSVTVNNTTYYYPFKYQSDQQGAPVTEYEMVLRLAEQYLIRSESEANLGNYTAADSDLNIIRNRAGLSSVTISDKNSLINAILHERQVELFTEWGQRWLDLKRTNTLNSVMGSPGNEYLIKVDSNGNWNPDWAIYPMSLTELQRNPSLTQNPGY